MQINPAVIEVLKQHNINENQGLLCLLAYHFGLDPETTIPPDVLQAVNVTRIVEKDYSNNQLTWNMGLFTGQEVAFEWVKDWMKPFGALNPDRAGVYATVMQRMKKFFQENPTYRKQDVYAARDMYLRTIRDPKFLMKSHKFIFDGAGVMRNSTLLMYCEKVANAGGNTSNQVGQVIK